MKIVISGAPRCDTGCVHCISESKPSGDDLEIRNVKLLARAVKRYGKKIIICFSGGGEPLLWSDLPQAYRILSQPDNVTSLQLVTSGCLKNDVRFPVLREVFKEAKKIGKPFGVSESFNLFSSSFPDRLANTLPYLLESTSKGIWVKLGAKDYSRDHIIKTYSFFERTLRNAVGHYSSLCLPMWDWKNGPEEIKNKIENALRCVPWPRKKTRGFFRREGFVSGAFYWPSQFPGKVVQTEFLSTSLIGRAKRFAQEFPREAALRCEASCKSLLLDSDGNFNVCCNPDFPAISLGDAGDNLQRVVDLKWKILYAVGVAQPKFVLSYPKMFKAMCQPCIEKAGEIVFGHKYE